MPRTTPTSPPDGSLSKRSDDLTTPFRKDTRISPSSDRLTSLPILVAIVFAGALLRGLAARGDLWFDEIWSMLLTASATSLPGVFTEIHHANNHYLNTAYLMWVGADAAPLVYRLPGIIAGATAVALLAVAVSRPPWRSRSLR